MDWFIGKTLLSRIFLCIAYYLFTRIYLPIDKILFAHYMWIASPINNRLKHVLRIRCLITL